MSLKTSNVGSGRASPFGVGAAHLDLVRPDIEDSPGDAGRFPVRSNNRELTAPVFQPATHQQVGQAHQVIAVVMRNAYGRQVAESDSEIGKSHRGPSAGVDLDHDVVRDNDDARSGLTRPHDRGA
jgi:hypothetical protein